MSIDFEQSRCFKLTCNHCTYLLLLLLLLSLLLLYKFSQLCSATGTCAFGALTTGILGAVTFNYYAQKTPKKNDLNSQKKRGAVDFPAAAVLTLTAMAITPLSARAVLKLSDKFLLRILG